MKKTSAEELERQYDREDPWGYRTNIADVERRRIIIEHLNRLGPFYRALDLCAGEGWITTKIPAKKIYATEASVQARCRWHSNICVWNPVLRGQFDLVNRVTNFDLVMITCALYENYDWLGFVKTINTMAKNYILTCNIADREYKKAIDMIDAKLIHLEEFEYHRSPDEKLTQRLRIYQK